MAYDTPSFASLLALEPHGPDTFIGVGPEYPWGRVYGGQAVAQGLWAATQTVPESHRVHSLHAYFIRGGDFDEPIRYEVDRIRDGRSFITRRVIARQSGGAIFNMSASFQVSEGGAEISTSKISTDVPPPVDVPVLEAWGPLFERRYLEDKTRGQSRAWLKVTEELGDDPALQACALAYLSDDFPTDAVMGLHPERQGWEQDEGRFISATLDHAIWFHHPMRADRWNLHDFESTILGGARGLANGKIFTEQGVHVASVAQEILLRFKGE